MTKTAKCLVAILLVALLVSIGLTSNFFQVEHSRRSVTPNELKGKTVVFYRDDCCDCKKVFPHLWWHHLWHHDLVFVNLNDEKNRQYIQQYNLVEIPTLVNQRQRYIGTNEKKIATILDQKKEEKSD